MDSDLGRARVVVTGAAGFLGSHLADRLLREGAEVVGVDNLVTGQQSNLDLLAARHPRFTPVHQDVSAWLDVPGRVTHVLHFASPASPRDYLAMPLETLAVGSQGTANALDLARRNSATFMLASTSEVYGDPKVHPQPEGYWGHVNPIGPRGVYDEAKRFAEALVMAHHRVHGLDVRIPRIFNTYGERMRPFDGRAVPTFIRQALAGEPITVHGDGSQTRSLIHVDDLVTGLLRLLRSDQATPCNLGNPQEVSVLRLATLVRELCDSDSPIVTVPRPIEDPTVRCPDISLARAVLDFDPRIDLADGLARTIAHAATPVALATA